MASLTRSLGESSDPKQPIKVAIIDDDDNYRSLMTRTVDESPDLESVGSYGGGEEALKAIPSSASEVVLIDVRMPGISGMECARQLRNVRPHLVIIMISGFDHPDTLAQALKAGADAYLTKPFSIAGFLQTLTVCPRYLKLGAKETDAPQTFLFTPKKETPEPTATTSSSLSESGHSLDNAIQPQGSTLDPKGGRMLDDPTTHKALWRMVMTLEQNFHTRQDLLQEASIHFWLLERHHPGQRLGWYLRGVRFYLHHLRNSGHSVDSPKRRGSQVSFADNWGEWEPWRNNLEFDEGIIAEVHARDILYLLANRLEPIDQEILYALAEGFGLREIARKLHVTHPFVRRHRLQIASLAIKLGVMPTSANSLSHISSKESKSAKV